MNECYLNKQTDLKGQLLLCLYVADPAICQSSNSVLGPYFIIYYINSLFIHFLKEYTFLSVYCYHANDVNIRFLSFSAPLNCKRRSEVKALCYVPLFFYEGSWNQG